MTCPFAPRALPRFITTTGQCAPLRCIGTFGLAVGAACAFSLIITGQVLTKSDTFNFLGFTFICGQTRTGKFQLQRKTRRDRMKAKLRNIETLRRCMHRPIPEQGKWLGRVVRGYFNYHAVPTNARALDVFRHHVTDLWRRTLRRRGQKDRITWARMTQLANEWLPKPIILHPWPSDRFAVTHPRWEPYAGKSHVRFCAGGAQQ